MMTKSYEELLKEIEGLRSELLDSKSTLEAIRTGQVDALVVQGKNGHELYTLHSADRSYRVFIEKMTEGAVAVNHGGLILYSNSKFASLLDRPTSAILGQSFFSLLAPESATDCKQSLEKAWNEDVKCEIQLHTGEKLIPVLLSVTAIELDEGSSLMIIVTDLSRQKQSERELKEKNRQLEELNRALATSNHDLQQFASVASHDLQEPLRKIQIFSNFLKDNNYTSFSDASKMHLDKIIFSVQRMKALIVDILSYSRLSFNESGFQNTDLNQMIADIIDDYEIKITESGAKVHIGVLPKIPANPGQLRQVFHNIIGNALKFTRKGVQPVINILAKEFDSRALGLELDNDADYCRLVIEDNGIGFSEQYSSTIFDLFTKLNGKEIFEGSGIGLAIAKKIIDKHKGFIVAKSKDGAGSQFNIILPIIQRKNEN